MPRRALRIGLIIVAVLIVLVAGAGTIFLLRFDPNSLNPRIVEAVRQATGRELKLNGPIGLKLSLEPTLQVTGVTFANPPWFSGPDMATLQRLDLQLAVLPLLHHEVQINRLILEHPNISLETNAQGQSNWEFSPASSPAPSSAAAPAVKPTTANPPTAQTSTPTTISVAQVHIDDGTVTWHDARSGATTTLGVKRLEAKAASPDSKLHLSLDATYNGAGFGLNGDVGPMTRLQDPTATTPWPVDVTLTAGGAKLTVDGTLTRPLQGHGYALTVQGAVPDLSALAPFVPNAKLPPLHDLRFDAKVADSGKLLPDISALTLHVGATDLGAYIAGLQVAKVDVTAPQPNQSVQADASGQLADAPLTLDATFGAPAALSSKQPSGPFPVDLTLHAAGAQLAIKGSVAKPDAWSGVDLGVAAQVPDLAALSPLVHHALPALKSVAFEGHLNDASGGLMHGATLHDMKLTTPDGDVSGDVGIALDHPLMLTAKLQSTRIDADALMAASGKPVATGPAAGAPPPPPPPKPAKGSRLFSDTPLPFALLQQVNADITLSVQDLKSGGADYHAIQAHAVLSGGKLRIDPFTADLPEGHFDAKLSADASQPAPPVALTVQAPGLAVAPLLALAGMPGYANGKLEVQADLHGAGPSPHAIAAGLDGTLGLSMQGGTIDTKLLNKLLGPTLEKANLLSLVGGGGSSEVRCFALRGTAQNGVMTLKPLLLDSTTLTLDGQGSVNLGEETLDLHLRPQGRVAGAGLVVPVRLKGSLRSPGVSVDALGAAEANVGSLAGSALGGGSPLGMLGGALLGGKVASDGSGDSCSDALALARGQSAPATSTPVASAPAPAPAAPKQKPPNAGAILRNLFH